MVALLAVLSKCLHGPELRVGKLIPSSYWSPIFLLQRAGFIMCRGDNFYGRPEFKKKEIGCNEKVQEEFRSGLNFEAISCFGNRLGKKKKEILALLGELWICM